MGIACCKLKSGGETELKTAALDSKSSTSEFVNEIDIEHKFDRTIELFLFSSEKIKVFS